ncbi:MAG: hypothetical protein PUH83_03760 [Bacteroidales bacterium]|nr:hypothetical protein [Bacteroidales bacterium]MDY5445716.1 hypothetical protein [Sodaliphilus sp.]
MKKVLHFLCWQVFISSVGKFSLPQLASFYFLSWRVFVSSVGVFLLLQLVNGEGKCDWCINSE